ncbi:chemotaxis protein CheW [Ferrimonas aestuarii]|uniref:Chemotaxis protein CheW n=1 Tax=Ferrimonas aestuarii TaxID=2569539 RepID=A0A4U1BX01_9GAMM|nr:chemotaxis protein CheW [Ferrimonas aestuarii]TKB58255.1 chemotaxis protein CheW [Ferrimonas aestuarii]
MSKAAEQALMDYFEVMLTPEEPKIDPIAQDGLQKLFEQALEEEAAFDARQQVLEAEPVQQQVDVVATDEAQEVLTAPATQPEDWTQQLEDVFQCLYFEVANLVIAVPLLTLGGIKRIGKLSQLPGSPEWVLGVQLDAQDGKLNVVDSGRWFMPERTEVDREDYHYLVRLGDSPWTLACESLLDAEPLSKSEVNWQTNGNKRPWLAGIVREKKCVVLNVPALIDMLDTGLDITVKES